MLIESWSRSYGSTRAASSAPSFCDHRTQQEDCTDLAKQRHLHGPSMERRTQPGPQQVLDKVIGVLPGLGNTENQAERCHHIFIDVTGTTRTHMLIMAASVELLSIRWWTVGRKPSGSDLPIGNNSTINIVVGYWWGDEDIFDLQKKKKDKVNP